MTVQDQPHTQELRLETGQDFFVALRSPDMGVRLATLTAVMRSPDKALQFGAIEGRDVVDELVIMLNNKPSLVRTAAAAALFMFGDKRSLNQAYQVFDTENELDILLMAGQRIGREADPVVFDYFLPYLSDGADSKRQKIAAHMLAGRSGLQAKELLRVALLAGESGAEPPLLMSETAALWLDELSGPLFVAACGFLQLQGVDAFALLRDHWQQLQPGIKSWLLQWGTAAFPDDTFFLISAALGDNEPTVQLTALESTLCYKNGQDLFRGELNGLPASDRDKRWHLAAIRAGIQIPNLRDRIFSDEDTDIRVALIRRLSSEKDTLEDLLRLLEDKDWRIRATATDLLVSLGETSVTAVSVLLKHDNLAVQAAASRVLIRLGRENLVGDVVAG